MVFYCTRCGARLQAQDDWASVWVRCGSCGGVTRTPDPGHDLPVAPLAEPELDNDQWEESPRMPVSEDEAFAALLRPHESITAKRPHAAEPDGVPFARVASLDYAAPVEPPFVEAADELAEKLANVQVAEVDARSTADCPYCSRGIPTFLRNCPFCRRLIAPSA